MVDIATSVVALNKVKVYALRGLPLPDNWVSDSAGKPMTDAAEALHNIMGGHGGGLYPIGGSLESGGYKGYGLSLMAHILGGTLSGGSFSPERNKTQKPGDPENIGHFLMAIDPEFFRPLETFVSDLDIVTDSLRRSAPANPAKPVLVPGDPEAISRRDRVEHGVPLPAKLISQISELAVAAGAPNLLRNVPVAEDAGK